jgi:hypothetical protein
MMLIVKNKEKEKIVTLVSFLDGHFVKTEILKKLLKMKIHHLEEVYCYHSIVSIVFSQFLSLSCPFLSFSFLFLCSFLGSIRDSDTFSPLSKQYYTSSANHPFSSDRFILSPLSVGNEYLVESSHHQQHNQVLLKNHVEEQSAEEEV